MGDQHELIVKDPFPQCACATFPLHHSGGVCVWTSNSVFDTIFSKVGCQGAKLTPSICLYRFNFCVKLDLYEVLELPEYPIGIRLQL